MISIQAITTTLQTILQPFNLLLKAALNYLRFSKSFIHSIVDGKNRETNLTEEDVCLRKYRLYTQEGVELDEIIGQENGFRVVFSISYTNEYQYYCLNLVRLNIFSFLKFYRKLYPNSIFYHHHLRTLTSFKFFSPI